MLNNTEFRRESTQPLGVPEEEPRAVLPVLPDPEEVKDAFKVDLVPSKGKCEAVRAPTPEAEAEFRQLRYRAHRYHGVTRRKGEPATQYEVDYAASQLARAAIRFTHALPGMAQNPGPNGCACVFCVKMEKEE